VPKNYSGVKKNEKHNEREEGDDVNVEPTRAGVDALQLTDSVARLGQVSPPNLATLAAVQIWPNLATLLSERMRRGGG
jgi:hypothetical protein